MCPDWQPRKRGSRPRRATEAAARVGCAVVGAQGGADPCLKGVLPHVGFTEEELPGAQAARAVGVPRQSP